MPPLEPTLDQLAAVLRSKSQQKADTSLARLHAATAGPLDLGSPQHRYELLQWLNKWLCRIRYPRDGEPDFFGDSLITWHEDHAELPESPIAELQLAAIGLLGDAYEDLARK